MSAANNSAELHLCEDTARVEVRLPQQASLERFRNDSEFRYTNDFEYPKTIMEYIRYYIGKILQKIFSGLTYDSARIIFLVLLIAVAAFVAAKMLGVDITGIFFRKPPPPVDLSDTVVDENVDRDVLAEMLDQALAGRQYRLAVRVIYLIMLQKLADAEQIHRQPDKTNRSYLNEITDRELRESFFKLARVYEYVWYGDFDITDEHYRLAEADFNELNRRLP